MQVQDAHRPVTAPTAYPALWPPADFSLVPSAAVALSGRSSHGGSDSARKLVLCLRIKRDADIGEAHLLLFEMASHYVALVVL